MSTFILKHPFGQAWPLFSLALAALCLTACEPREESLTHNLPPSIADRVMVLSADTLVIDGRHVHLSNASAPQSALHARCWAEALASQTEVEFVRDLVQHAASIDFKPNGKLDEYGRALGLVTMDRLDLGDLLYNRGMAARLTEPRFDWCQPISQKDEAAPPLSSLVNLGD
jgi:hypothetical protein